MNSLVRLLITTKIFWGSIAIASFIVMKPTGQPKRSFRYISSGLTIQTNKNTPPRIIFDLINKETTSEEKKTQEPNETNTNLNEVVGTSLAPVVAKAPRSIEYAKNPNMVRVTGTIQLRGGAMLGENSLELRRFEDGIAIEVGHIDLSSATFYIDVARPAGVLYARIISPTGSVLAQGEYRFPAFVSEKSISGVDIIVNKNQGFAFQLQEEGKKIQENGMIRSSGLISQNLSLEENEHVYSGYSYNSSLMVVAETEKHSKSTHIVQSGRRQKLPVHSRGLTAAAINLARQEQRQSQHERNNSLVWGRVVSDVGPLANIKVEIEGHPEIQPIYLNSTWLPDGSLNSTSDTGGFFFLDLPEGFYSIQATAGGVYTSHSNVIVQSNAVSPITMKASLLAESVEVKVFDAISGNPISAKVEMQSIGHSFIVNGYREVFISPIERMSLMNVTPLLEEYLPAAYQYWDNEGIVHAPVLPKSWLDRLMSSQQIGQDPANGMVVGFVVDHEFEVYMSQGSLLMKPPVIYFNSQGDAVGSGVAGGGFIIPNVKPGVETVAVASQSSSDLSTRLVITNSDTISVLKFHF